jgi:VWFA-related protein
VTRDGAFVSDLTRDDFELRDEGAVQAVDAFSLMLLPGNVAQKVARAESGQAPPERTTVVPPQSRRILVLLDDLHIIARRSIVVKGVIRDYIERLSRPSDRIALLTTSGVAPRVDFTTQRDLLLRALDTFGGQKLPSATLEGMRRSATLDADDRPDADIQQRALNARKTFEEIQRVATILGRTSSDPTFLILVSEGPDYDTSDVISSRAGNDTSDVVHAFERAIRICADSGIPIHTLDPRGLQNPQGDVTEVQGEFMNQQNLSLLSENSQALRTLRDLSRMTGGTAIVEQNDLKAGLNRIDDAMSSYYLLGFTPSSPTGKRFHRLAVKVHRAGVRVIARDGYLRW